MCFASLRLSFLHSPVICTKAISTYRDYKHKKEASTAGSTASARLSGRSGELLRVGPVLLLVPVRRRGELRAGRSGDTRAIRSAEISVCEGAGYAVRKNTKLI